MAMADGKVEPNEVKLLERVFGQLGLLETDVYARIHGAKGVSRSDGLTSVREARTVDDRPIPRQPREASFGLDESAIERIKGETAAVSQALATVFVTEDEEPGVEAAAGDHDASSDDVGGAYPREGLDRRHAALLTSLLERDTWAVADYQQLCSQFGLYPSGATETLNEWAFERFEEPVIEDGEPISINAEIVGMEAA